MNEDNKHKPPYVIIEGDNVKISGCHFKIPEGYGGIEIKGMPESIENCIIEYEKTSWYKRIYGRLFCR